jgi:CRP-like cAMP-binding protein
VPDEELPARAPSLTRWISERSAQQDLDLLHESHFARLRQVGARRSVEAGTRLCTAGERATHVLVVTAGEVELLARLPGGGRTAMAVVRPGGVIADIPLLLGSPMPFDAVASRPTDVIRLTEEQWVTMLGSSPALSFRWMTSIARRLDSDRRRLAMITTRPLEAQVAYLLLDHQEAQPDGRCEVRLSHDLMAQLLGARRPSISRVMASMHARGLTAPGYGRTRLLDVPRLRELAGPDPLP